MKEKKINANNIKRSCVTAAKIIVSHGMPSGKKRYNVGRYGHYYPQFKIEETMYVLNLELTKVIDSFFVDEQ